MSNGSAGTLCTPAHSHPRIGATKCLRYRTWETERMGKVLQPETQAWKGSAETSLGTLGQQASKAPPGANSGCAEKEPKSCLLILMSLFLGEDFSELMPGSATSDEVQPKPGVHFSFATTINKKLHRQLALGFFAEQDKFWPGRCL